MSASLAGAALGPSTWNAAAATPDVDAPDTATRLFPPNVVRLDGGPLAAAQRRNLAYLLALDPQRLLAPFRRSAGLPSGPSYGSWESAGLDGHIGGHVLSALSLAVAATGDERARTRLREMLDALQACQQAVAGDPLMAGYLGGVPNGREAWAALSRGELQVDSFQVNGRWVPWYNLHKTMAGLRDAWLLADEDRAKPMLMAMADWTGRITAALSDAQMQTMLRCEHGGMAEVLAELAMASGEPRYRALALRFVDRSLLGPLAAGEDRLTGLHANTQLPKILAFQRLGEAGALPDGEAAADFFWERVAHHRSVPIGGHGVREHFHDAADFTPVTEAIEGPESCNTYNMLQISALLWQRRPGRDMMDHVERALFNHVLSAQHPRTGGLVYFTPLRPHHHRLYSTVHEGMWCCVGTGLEAHGRHNLFIFGRDAKTLWVNLFAPATLDAPDEGLHLRQETGFPDDGVVTLSWLAPSTRALAVRLPGWVRADGWTLQRNGRRIKARPGEDGYLHLRGPWRVGDRVRLQLRMDARLEGLPDGSAERTVLVGPIVLAARSEPALAAFAPLGGPSTSHDEGTPPPRYFGDDSRMGHVPQGLLSRPEATLVLREPARLLNELRPVPGQALTFTTRALAPAGARPGAVAPVTLEPFFRLHEARYQALWPVLDSAELERRAEQRRQQAVEQAALEARTVDRVAPGEQQPEVDHAYAAEGGDAGIDLGRHWRHATHWFGYTLRDPRREGRALLLTLNKGDAGRDWHLELNGQVLPRPPLRADAPEPLYTLEVPLPPQAANQDGELVLRFVAAPGSIAGGLYDLRLLK
jgi:DUF1680 family protein